MKFPSCSLNSDTMKSVFSIMLRKHLSFTQYIDRTQVMDILSECLKFILLLNDLLEDLRKESQQFIKNFLP